MSVADVAALPADVSEFRPNCPGCTPERLTGPGATPCSFYDCPGLPKNLEVTCDMCMYDFAADDGQIRCDHDSCETARRLKANVETYRAWVALIEAEFAQRT